MNQRQVIRFRPFTIAVDGTISVALNGFSGNGTHLKGRWPAAGPTTTSGCPARGTTTSPSMAVEHGRNDSNLLIRVYPAQKIL
jgi:hypothetical protein